MHFCDWMRGKQSCSNGELQKQNWSNSTNSAFPLPAAHAQRVVVVVVRLASAYPSRLFIASATKRDDSS